MSRDIKYSLNLKNDLYPPNNKQTSLHRGRFTLPQNFPRRIKALRAAIINRINNRAAESVEIAAAEKKSTDAIALTCSAR